MIDLSRYTCVEIDSRKCIEKSIFICIKKNEQYISNAIANGATLIIHQHKIKDYNIKSLKVKDIDFTLVNLLNYFYPFDLKLIGITGTDGKTSTSLITYSLINQVDRCGYIGTSGVKYNNHSFKSINTTPDIISIRKYLHDMTKENINYVTIECSSEGILNKRLLGLKFDCLVYTNISHEHLNTHKTMRKYFKTKLSLINQLDINGSIFVNNDEKYFKKIKHKNIYRYGLSTCYCKASNINSSLTHTSFNCTLIKNNPIIIPLFGIYNVYNTLASILILNKYNMVDKIDFSQINRIKGRFELLNDNIIIDFAHTPNSLENLLLNIKNISHKKIILVLGAAGNKDKSKRPLLGNVANKYADKIIITSEDPKDEPLTNIFHDLIKKIKKEYYLVLFRKDAIKLGINLLDENNILVIVGKGFENYETIYNYRITHNDYLYTKSLLNA